MHENCNISLVPCRSWIAVRDNFRRFVALGPAEIHKTMSIMCHQSTVVHFSQNVVHCELHCELRDIAMRCIVALLSHCNYEFTLPYYIHIILVLGTVLRRKNNEDTKERALFVSSIGEGRARQRFFPSSFQCYHQQTGKSFNGTIRPLSIASVSAHGRPRQISKPGLFEGSQVCLFVATSELQCALAPSTLSNETL